MSKQIRACHKYSHTHARACPPVLHVSNINKYTYVFAWVFANLHASRSSSWFTRSDCVRVKNENLLRIVCASSGVCKRGFRGLNHSCDREFTNFKTSKRFYYYFVFVLVFFFLRFTFNNFVNYFFHLRKVIFSKLIAPVLMIVIRFKSFHNSRIFCTWTT